VLVEQLTSLDEVRFELNEAHLDAASATLQLRRLLARLPRYRPAEEGVE
jgi:hypothetical protein